VAYNLITTDYAAHRASPVEPEIDAICNAVADMIAATFAPLDLDKPLRGASGAAVALPPQLPWAVVLPDPAGGNAEQTYSGQQAHYHRLLLLFIFGPPMPGDRLVTENLRYLHAAHMAITANQHLDCGTTGIKAATWDWGTLDYAGKAWAALQLHLTVRALYALRWNNMP